MVARNMLAVHINVSNLDSSAEFLRSIGYENCHTCVPDIKQWLEDGPSRLVGVSPESLSKIAALRLPNDPFMHLWLFEWSREAQVQGGWPRKYNQTGMSGVVLLVDSAVDAAAAVEARGGRISVGPHPIKFGDWEASVTIGTDPDGNSLELLECPDWSPPVADPARYEIPADNPLPLQPGKVFLHCQMNTDSGALQREFYTGALGFEDDPGVEMRPGTPSPTGAEAILEGLGIDRRNSADGGGVGGFLRLPGDVYGHIELLRFRPGEARDPGVRYRYDQKGIVRICIRCDDHDEEVRRLWAGGVRVPVPNQITFHSWGDSKWSFFEDPDANLMCFEQWWAARTFGTRF
jgi:catechol 2,3-dioxygenase-like lactoylglutathione lyase family enzyme